jgi:hypothetical protein
MTFIHRRLLGLAVLASFALAPNAFAEVGYCPPDRARKAEYEYTRITTWADLHQSYRLYHGCDNGGVAEGYDDVVKHLLVRQWSQLPTVAADIQRDGAFSGFITRHINEEWDRVDLMKVKSFAQHRCPSQLDRFCRGVTGAVEAAIIANDPSR